MRDDDNEVRRRLRGAAQAHRPDRERMRARVEQGMAAGPRPERQSKASRRAGAGAYTHLTPPTNREAKKMVAPRKNKKKKT
ncbi:hypothetical protein RMO59_34900, partial [Streptomyces alfalfae]